MDDPDPLLDALVVADVRSGNRRSFGILIDRYQERLQATLAASLRHDDEVATATSQAFVQAFAELAQYDAARPFFPWLRGIAMDVLRRQAPVRDPARHDGDDHLAQVLRARADNVDDAAQVDAQVAALERCLDRLPAEDATLLADAYRSGHSLSELAARHRTGAAPLALRLLRLRDRLHAGGSEPGRAQVAAAHDEALAEVLAGEPAAAALAQVAALVRDDGNVRARFLAQVAIAGALRAHHLPAQARAALRSRTLASLAGARAPEAGDASVRAPLPAPARAAARRLWRGPLVLATTLLLLALLLVERVPVAARIERAGSDAMVERHGTAIPAHAAGTLRSGDRLRSGTQALVVAFADGTTVECRAGSGLLLERVTSPRRLRLDQGSMDLRVARQAAGQALVAATAQATVTVAEAGGRLQLDAGGDSGFIAVQDGTVGILRPGDGWRATLGRGAALVLDPGRPPVPFATTPRAGGGWDGSGDGLRGDYHGDLGFHRLAATRVDPEIRFAWPGSPISSVPADHFTVRWSGQVQPRVSGPCTFTLRADDGARLWIDGRRLIDTWERPDIADQYGTITLAAGRRYDLRLDFFDEVEDAEITLWWEAPGQAKEVVPASQLYAP